MKRVTISKKLGTQALGLGGPGSGNFAHVGRPGQVGGSAPKPIMSDEDISDVDIDNLIDRIFNMGFSGEGVKIYVSNSIGVNE